MATDAYYAPAVQWAVANGITNGTSATTFSPDNCCTCGQIITFLYRFTVDADGNDDGSTFAGQSLVSSLERISASRLNCWLYTPENAVENMPLIVYLHSSTGKGDDPNVLLSSDGFV